MIGLLLIGGLQTLRSTPDLGTAKATCRANEPGPAIAIVAKGLKDRAGLLRAELYPANDGDFLADDNILMAQGKTFRRVTLPLPASGPVGLCIRAPAPGIYALVLLHDRDSDGKFSVVQDGVGFAGNPRLGLSRPHASAAVITIGPAVTTATIVLNYRHGFFSFGPVEPAVRR